MTKESLHTLMQHTLSRLLGKLGNCGYYLVKYPFIAWFTRYYNVDMSLAVRPSIKQYRHFNDFFTRKLRSEMRPITQKTGAVASPVDGYVSALGLIREKQLLQAKDHHYTLHHLLAGSEVEAEQFEHGHFITLYLAPSNYHRIHIPLSGRLLTMRYVPGRLFSVSQRNVGRIPQLFARNERIILHFKTDVGFMAVILVGALIVGSMSVPWHGVVAPSSHMSSKDWDYTSRDLSFKIGDEIGQFLMGSTVIVLLSKRPLTWESKLVAEHPVQYGSLIASCSRSSDQIKAG